MAGAASGMDAQQQMMMSAMGYGYLLPYARSHETQADEVGLMLAAAACFDPREAVPLWQRMGQPVAARRRRSSPPPTRTRVPASRTLQALMPKALSTGRSSASRQRGGAAGLCSPHPRYRPLAQQQRRVS